MTFYQKIEQINEILRAQGVSVIQEKKMMKDGRVIGKVQYGYVPQAVFDAVNAVIGPENWTYEVHSNEVIENQAIACVEVYFNTPNGWLSKGKQWGQSNVVKGNVGDALKGAVTDGIQKGFSLWSIGSDAYAGKLEAVWKGQGANPKPKSQPQGQSDPTPPKLEGVVFEKKKGRILVKGKTYGKSAALKAAGFQWDAKEKVWWKQAA